MSNDQPNGCETWQDAAKRLSTRHTKLGLITSGDIDQLVNCAPGGIIHVNRELAAALINLPLAKRPRKASEILDEMVSAVAAPFVVLDGLEILFEPSLEIDVVPLLQQLARSQVVFALWPGELSGSQLSYAQLGHVEYQSYRLTGTDDIEVIHYQNLIKDSA